MSRLKRFKDTKLNVQRRCAVCGKGAMRLTRKNTRFDRSARRVWVCCSKSCGAQRIY